jgi:hypothetical protein
MNARVPLSPDVAAPADADADAAGDALFDQLLRAPSASAAPAAGLVIGELLAIREDGTPLVALPGGASRALPAMSLVDLHAAHIGLRVALMFDGADPERPVVVGVPRGQAAWPLEAKPAQVDVDADGQRLLVTAKDQLVLRCGKASITLTKAGKVLIEGSYLLSRSTGVNRIKGGSVQLN